jgi:hypothetical protein
MTLLVGPAQVSSWGPLLALFLLLLLLLLLMPTQGWCSHKRQSGAPTR